MIVMYDGSRNSLSYSRTTGSQKISNIIKNMYSYIVKCLYVMRAVTGD